MIVSYLAYAAALLFGILGVAGFAGGIEHGGDLRRGIAGMVICLVMAFLGVMIGAATATEG